ncbi:MULTISPECIES: TraV family lipoprotein [Comamonadaceae]|uniref:Type IV conjugative transfer system protein TraV n=1 Tax=Alicycliphilus denitrificans (strain DSM 14773 / CIP 107495 / K601) TaxID=596154 RepID=F4G9V4_ALIDK|nr:MULTISPECIES: TraV family lipoprotein [Comamonadaceae]AEB85686.1 type IV conjugative transfer system protein TraV [Alicycliphilus denitrificans K601]
MSARIAWIARWAVAALLLPLAGCMNMSGLSGSSKYSCAAPEGVACDSVSGTYTNALHNNLPSQQASASRAEPQGTTAAPTASVPVRQPMAGAPRSIADGSADGAPPLALRSQARVLRLWTKPWEDADGDLWDQGYVYVQVDAGRWQIEHVRQRIRDQYAPLRPPPAAAPAATPGDAPASSGLAPSAPDGAAPAEGAVQRPAPFNAFPSLAQPPAGLGARPQ